MFAEDFEKIRRVMLNTQQVCRLFGRSKSTIRRWRREGMPYMLFQNREVRFDRQKVLDWAKQYGKETKNS